MKLAYYPGCTLKTKAKNLEDAAIAALNKLGITFGEMPRWNCCGAVFSLADDDLIHHAAPVRNLIRAQQEGADTIITIFMAFVIRGGLHALVRVRKGHPTWFYGLWTFVFGIFYLQWKINRNLEACESLIKTTEKDSGAPLTSA